MSDNPPANGYKLAHQYRSELMGLIFALVLGAYTFIFFAQQFDERERERMEVRSTQQYRDIITRLERIEDKLK